MTWTISHSVGLFLGMILMTSIAITIRFIRQRCKRASAHPTHNRLQQFLAKCYLLPCYPAHNPDTTHGLPTIGLEERSRWDATILAQNDEAAIRGLREDYRHSNNSLTASVYERDLAHEDGTPLVHPPPAYSQIARVAEPASALNRLSALAQRTITSSISPTDTSSATVLPPLEHVGETTQPTLSTHTSAMPSQHFTTQSGNRYDLASIVAGTPSLHLPINDTAEVAQHLDQLNGLFRPLAAYEEIASCVVERQRRGDVAAVGAESVYDADLAPVPNPRYYRVDPPENLEDRIRAAHANANTLSEITILDDLRGHCNGTPPSALPARQVGVPARTRTPGTPRPMAFGHRPVLRGPMPSQAATFTDDSEDENDRNDSTASRTPSAMNETGALRTDPQRVRAPGTPRPMVFGTRPVFCGRMPSQAVTVESDHEGDDSDATIRGGALINYCSDLNNGSQKGLHGSIPPYANLDLGNEHRHENLAVDGVDEPSRHCTDAHDVSPTTSGELAATNDNAKKVLWSGVSTDCEIVGPGEGYVNEAGWVWVEFVPNSVESTSTNDQHENTLAHGQTLFGKNSISEGAAPVYNLFSDDVLSEDNQAASTGCNYSTVAGVDEGWITDELLLVRRGERTVIKAQKWKALRNLRRSKIGNRYRKMRRARKLIQMRIRKEMSEISHSDVAVPVEAEKEFRRIFEHEGGMICFVQPPTTLKAAQLERYCAERARYGWLPLIAENDTSSQISRSQLTFEEQLPLTFKHNDHSDTRHWQCQSSLLACNRCRARRSPSDHSRDEITLEQLDSLPRKHIWRFELHRVFQAVKEAMIHTAVDEFLEAWTLDEEQTVKRHVLGVPGVETGIRGGYLSDPENEHKDDDKDHAQVSVQGQATLQALNAIGETMITTTQLDFKAMLHCPIYLVRDDVWRNFGNGQKVPKVRSLEKLWKACEIIDTPSFEVMARVKAVLDGRARKLDQKGRRLEEGLRGGTLEGVDDASGEKLTNEEAWVRHPEYKSLSRLFFSGHETVHDSSSAFESGSDLSSVSTENLRETSQDNSTISSQISKDILTEGIKEELAAAACCLFLEGSFRANASMGETEKRNRLRGIISIFCKVSNGNSDGTMFSTAVIGNCSLYRRLHTSMWAAPERLWSKGDLSATPLSTREENLSELGMKPEDRAYQEPKVMIEIRKTNEFATNTFASGSLKASTEYLDVRNIVSISKCEHGKNKRKPEDIEICEHGLKVPRVNYWSRDTAHQYRVMAVASMVRRNQIHGTIEEVAELERMVVLYQILEPQPRAEGPNGWPMVGKEMPRIVSCMGPKQYCLLEDKELGSIEPIKKCKAANYPQMPGNWFAFVKGDDSDGMSVSVDDRDDIEIRNSNVETNIAVGRHPNGGIEVETQGVPRINAALRGLCPRVAIWKMNAIRWPQRLRTWRPCADEAAPSLRGGDNAMGIQATITVSAPKSAKKVSEFKRKNKALKVEEEVIGFASGAVPRLSWFGKWNFVIPGCQLRSGRPSMERLNRHRETQKIIMSTFGNELSRKSWNRVQHLSPPPVAKATARGDVKTLFTLSFCTSTSGRDDGSTQAILEQDLPYYKDPHTPLEASETSLRDDFREFLRHETDLPHLAFPCGSANLATTPFSNSPREDEKAPSTLRYSLPYLEIPRDRASLRGGGNPMSEVSEPVRDMAQVLGLPNDLGDMAVRSRSFKAYTRRRIRGPKEIKENSEANSRTRATASALMNARYLRPYVCRRPTPKHRNADFVCEWKDVAWNRLITIFIPFDRRNRYSRGVLRADMWNKDYFRDGTRMRYEHGSCQALSQNLARRSQWTRGARRRVLDCREELVGSLSGLKGEEFASSRICGGDRRGLPCTEESLRGGQLTNEDEKDHMEGLECQGAETPDDQQEGQIKPPEGHNDANEYQIQCSGQDAATLSPSIGSTKVTTNAFSAPSSLSFLNQEFVPSPSPTIMSLYQASLYHRKETGAGYSMSWLELNHHDKRCRPGMCAYPCRAIVTLQSKPARHNPRSRPESINPIGYWFGEEAEDVSNHSSVGLRGGLLRDEKEQGKEDREESDWRSPNSLRDGELDPLAHFLTRQFFSRGRVDMPTQDTNANLSGHNYDCQPGSCSLFCSVSGTLPTPDFKTESQGNIGANIGYVKNISPDLTGLSDASSILEMHSYSQRIVELNKILGLTVRTKFSEEYCVEGHTHPEGMDEYTESDQSRRSFRKLKGERPHLAPERRMPPLISPLPIRQKPHWWNIDFPRQVQTDETSPPAGHAGWSLRGGVLDESLEMPRSGVNGWLFDRSTNWTFCRVKTRSKGKQNGTKGTDTSLYSDYEERTQSNTPPLTPIGGHELEKLATVCEKMTFVSEELSPPTSRNASVSFESGTISPRYRLKRRFNPYLCWPDWAYKLYDPPYSLYDSPTCDTTGRWRRPVSRHLLAGILETLPETTGMFRRLEDGAIVRIAPKEMTVQERKTMLQYVKRKKLLRRDSWVLYPRVEDRFIVEEAGELKKIKEVKAGLRGGAIEYPPSGPLAVHFDGNIRWSFGCCGCRPMIPDSPVAEAVSYEGTSVHESDTDSRQSEESIILSPTQSPVINEQRSKWYSRPVDAKKLRGRLRGLLQAKSQSKRFKDKHGNMVGIEFPDVRNRLLKSERLKPSEVLISKIDSQKTRALGSKPIRTSIRMLGCGLRGGGGPDDDEKIDVEMDYPSPPASDDEKEDEVYVSIALSSSRQLCFKVKKEETSENSENDVLDEQEMDYELSADLLPLEDAYTELRAGLRQKHPEAMGTVDQPQLFFQGDKLQPKCLSKPRSAEHNTWTATLARVKDDSEGDPEEDMSCEPNLQKVEPTAYEMGPDNFSSPITQVYNVDMEDFPPLPSLCEDITAPSDDEASHSSVPYSAKTSTSPSSVCSDELPPKGMWVMVHPRVTELLVAGTYRYKSKHLEKNSGLMRLHDDWADGTPSSMRLMTSSSAFREELKNEKSWEWKERGRLDSIKRLQGILKGFTTAHPNKEAVADEKEGMEVLDTEVSSGTKDDTHTISVTTDPSKEKDKKDSDFADPIIETGWSNLSIKMIGLSRHERHLISGESERIIEKKAKRLMADVENVQLEVDERRRRKTRSNGESYRPSTSLDHDFNSRCQSSGRFRLRCGW